MAAARQNEMNVSMAVVASRTRGAVTRPWWRSSLSTQRVDSPWAVLYAMESKLVKSIELENPVEEDLLIGILPHFVGGRVVILPAATICLVGVEPYACGEGFPLVGQFDGHHVGVLVVGPAFARLLKGLECRAVKRSVVNLNTRGDTSLGVYLEKQGSRRGLVGTLAG